MVRGSTWHLLTNSIHMTAVFLYSLAYVSFMPGESWPLGGRVCECSLPSNGKYIYGLGFTMVLISAWNCVFLCGLAGPAGLWRGSLIFMFYECVLANGLWMVFTTGVFF